MKKTIFIDIDGVLLRHFGNLSKQITTPLELLPGVIDKLNEWELEGHRIILITGRKESMRKITEDQLFQFGIFYDQLVMGLPRGERIIINDKKPGNEMSTCRAIEIKRNDGIGEIKI